MCSLYENSEKFLGIFTLSGLPDLLLYAYIPSLIFLGSLVFVFWRKKAHRSFLYIVIAFVVSISIDTFIWLVLDNTLIYYAWYFFVPWNIVFNFLLYKHIQESCGLKSSSFVNVLIILLLILSFSRLNTKAYDLVECVGVFGSLWDVLYFLRIVFLGYLSYIFFSKRCIQDRLITFSVLFVVVLELFADIYSDFNGRYILDGLRIIGYLLFVAVYIYQKFIKHKDTEKMLGRLRIGLYSIIGLVSFGCIFLINKKGYEWLLVTSLIVNVLLVLFSILKEQQFNLLKQKVEELESDQSDILLEVTDQLGIPQPKIAETKQIKDFIRILSKKESRSKSIYITHHKVHELFIHTGLGKDAEGNLGEIYEKKVLVDKNLFTKNTNELLGMCDSATVAVSYSEKEIIITGLGNSAFDRAVANEIKDELRLVNIGLVIGDTSIVMLIPFVK